MTPVNPLSASLTLRSLRRSCRQQDDEYDCRVGPGETYLLRRSSSLDECLLRQDSQIPDVLIALVLPRTEHRTLGKVSLNVLLLSTEVASVFSLLEIHLLSILSEGKDLSAERFYLRINVYSTQKSLDRRQREGEKGRTIELGRKVSNRLGEVLDLLLAKSDILVRRVLRSTCIVRINLGPELLATSSQALTEVDLERCLLPRELGTSSSVRARAR